MQADYASVVMYLAMIKCHDWMAWLKHDRPEDKVHNCRMVMRRDDAVGSLEKNKTSDILSKISDCNASKFAVTFSRNNSFEIGLNMKCCNTLWQTNWHADIGKCRKAKLIGVPGRALEIATMIWRERWPSGKTTKVCSLEFKMNKGENRRIITSHSRGEIDIQQA